MEEKPYLLEVADRDAIAPAIRHLRRKARETDGSVGTVVVSETGMRFVVTLDGPDAIAEIRNGRPPLQASG